MEIFYLTLLLHSLKKVCLNGGARDIAPQFKPRFDAQLVRFLGAWSSMLCVKHWFISVSVLLGSTWAKTLVCGHQMMRFQVWRDAVDACTETVIFVFYDRPFIRVGSVCWSPFLSWSPIEGEDQCLQPSLVYMSESAEYAGDYCQERRSSK